MTFPQLIGRCPPILMKSRKLREVAKWPLWEKLEWLESAQIIAQSLEQSRLKQAELAREKQRK